MGRAPNARHGFSIRSSCSSRSWRFGDQKTEIAAEMAVAKTTTVAAFTRKRPARKPFPEHLPRERVIVPGPDACLCCGGTRLSKLGEDVTETLESDPRQWKVIQYVRAIRN